jgi:S-DNA-T family DNA segregation ATPase FtsK/SpoIIIE
MGYRITGFFTGVIALCATISLAVAMLDPGAFFSGAISVPGRALLRSLDLAAWWVPLYLVILTFFVVQPDRLTWSNVALVSALHVPILTIATLLRLAGGSAEAPLTALLVESFTMRGAILITSLTLAIESLVILQVWRTLLRRAPLRPREPERDIVAIPSLLPAPDWPHHDTDDEIGSEDEIDTDEEIEAPIQRQTDRDDVGIISIDELKRVVAPDPEDVEEDDRYDDDVPLPLMLRARYVDDYDDEYGDDPDDDVPEIVPAYQPPASGRYEIPIDGVLAEYGDTRYWEIDDGTRDAAEVLRITLEEFGIKADVTGIRKGPVITMFEILPAPGVKLEKISNLANNIALRLAASSVRIVAPIPGKHAVGIEIPNRERNIVSFAELLRVDDFTDRSQGIPIALGKDIAGEAQIIDLTHMPHLLIAGATGSGKSVCVNSIICSILYRRTPAEVKLILIDPKIVELKFYNDIPHLLTPVITDPKRAFQALQYLIYEMERRYSLLDSLGVRDIHGYNAKVKRKRLATEPIPYIAVVIDEFADLMATSGKELESTVARLAAMSRAVGIHLVLATQRPSTDVITGLIKANIPSRIAFMVASKVDSRIIIDMMGAEKLLGRGDMLFTSASDPFPVRMQGAFLTEEEVERVVAHVKQYGEPEYIDEEIFIEDDEDDIGDEYLEDPLMEKAIEIVTNSQKASASYLQRRLKVGYNRAARMVEEMERLGIVGPQNGSKPREVLDR